MCTVSHFFLSYLDGFHSFLVSVFRLSHFTLDETNPITSARAVAGSDQCHLILAKIRPPASSPNSESYFLYSGEPSVCDGSVDFDVFNCGTITSKRSTTSVWASKRSNCCIWRLSFFRRSSTSAKGTQRSTIVKIGFLQDIVPPLSNLSCAITNAFESGMTMRFNVLAISRRSWANE